MNFDFLIEIDAISREDAEQIKAVLNQNENVIVAGDLGSGITTILRLLFQIVSKEGRCGQVHITNPPELSWGSTDLYLHTTNALDKSKLQTHVCIPSVEDTVKNVNYYLVDKGVNLSTLLIPTDKPFIAQVATNGAFEDVTQLRDHLKASILSENIKYKTLVVFCKRHEEGRRKITISFL